MNFKEILFKRTLNAYDIMLCSGNETPFELYRSLLNEMGWYEEYEEWRKDPVTYPVQVRIEKILPSQRTLIIETKGSGFADDYDPGCWVSVKSENSDEEVSIVEISATSDKIVINNISNNSVVFSSKINLLEENGND